jgi:hypothetical protein
MRVESSTGSRSTSHLCGIGPETATNSMRRSVLRRGNFRSIDDLRAQVLAFIDYFNRTMAKPFKWTYQGKPLHA